MSDEISYSILMSVYKNDNPLFLREALKSAENQTFPSNNIVVVKDGRLTAELDDVLNEFSQKYKNLFICGYENNMGLGHALNYGLSFCQNEIVLRMDADDISHKERAETQVNRMIRDDVDLSSSTVDLFEGDITNIVGHRRLPSSEKEIRKFSQTRSPFNHPSVIFKKTAVLKAGGYKTLLYKEDYYLWVRMIQSGFKFNNIDDSLVSMRINNETFFRRKNKTVYKNSIWLNTYMRKTKYISLSVYLKNKVIYFFRQFLPSSISARITKKLWK